MNPLRLGDFVLEIGTVITQVIVARLYFTRWKPRFGDRLRQPVSIVLCTLWAILAFDLFGEILRLHPGRWLSTWVHGALETIGATWAMTAALSLGIYFVYGFWVSRLTPAFSAKRRTLIHSAGVVAMSTPFAAAAFGGIIERTRFRVVETDLPIPNLPEDLDGLRIAQISDLHVSPFLSVKHAARVVDMTNELRPHLTVVTGDLISEQGDPLEETIRELARLRADAGVLGCLGNHEYYARCQNLTVRLSARYGMDFLRHRARPLRFGNSILNVAGIDYQSPSKKAEYLLGAEKLVLRNGTGVSVTNLLLSHNPDVFPLAVRQGYDAVLSGHTHGGQVTVEVLNRTLNFARFFTPYVAGLYRIDGRSCYVNAGIGTIGMPVRLGAPPEISLFRLRRA